MPQLFEHIKTINKGLLLFSPVIPCVCVRCRRMLRNYRKHNSFNNWCIKSRRFHNEEFTTIVPLRHFSNQQVAYSSICARLIVIAIQGSPNLENVDSLLLSLNTMNYWNDLSLPQESTKEVVLAHLREIERLPARQQKSSQGKRWLIEGILNPATITDAMLVNLCNRILYLLVKNINKKVRDLKQKYNK